MRQSDPLSGASVASEGGSTPPGAPPGPPPRIPKAALTALIATLAVNGLSIGFLGTMLTSLGDAYPEFSSAVIALAVTSYFFGSTLGTAYELLKTEYLSLSAAAALALALPKPLNGMGAVGAAGRDADGRAKSDAAADTTRGGGAEVAGARQSLVLTLFVGSAASLVLLLLPPTVGGSHANSFAVYVVVVMALGWSVGVQLTAVSTVIAAWDVRVSAAAVNATNFAFSIAAVAASWIQNGFVACGSALEFAPAYDASKFAWLLLAAVQFGTGIAAAFVDFAQHSAAGPSPGPSDINGCGCCPHRRRHSVQPAAAAGGAVVGGAHVHVSVLPAAAPTAPAERRRVVAVALGFGGLRRSGFARPHGHGHGHGHGHDSERRAAAAVAVTLPVSAPAAAAVSSGAGSGGAGDAMAREVGYAKRYSKALLSDRRFWALLMAMCMSNGVVMVTGTWVYSVAVEEDMGDPTPTLVASAFWAGTVVGRLTSTQFPSPDARSTHRRLLALVACGTLTPIGIALAGAWAAGLVVFAAASGLVYACVFPLLVTLEMQCQLFVDSHSHSNALAVGLLVLSSQFGAVTLPTVFGAAAGAIGSKRTAFFTAAAAMLLAAFCVLSFNPTAPAAADAAAQPQPKPDALSDAPARTATLPPAHIHSSLFGSSLSLDGFTSPVTAPVN